MVLAAIVMFPVQKAQADTAKLKIVPASPGPYNTGSVLTVNISIQDVTDLITWQVNVSWDPTQLSFNDIVWPDPTNDFVFANEPIYTLGPLTGTSSAVFSVVCNTAGGGHTFTGSGTLAQLKLNVLTDNPTCEIKFENIPVDTFLLDSEGNDIPFDTETWIVPEMSSLLLIVLLFSSSSIAVILKKKARIRK
jgi:hypothetical protein